MKQKEGINGGRDDLLLSPNRYRCKIYRMNENESQRILLRITELRDNPGTWMITRLESDGTELGRALRMTNGTYLEVAAVHFFPPGGGNYRVDTGAEITDPEIIKVLDSSYLDAMKQREQET